jgi:hypothetical protein
LDFGRPCDHAFAASILQSDNVWRCDQKLPFGLHAGKAIFRHHSGCSNHSGAGATEFGTERKETALPLSAKFLEQTFPLTQSLSRKL